MWTVSGDIDRWASFCLYLSLLILRLLNFRELFVVFSIGIKKSKLNRGWIFINTYIYLTRNQLYNEVWQSSIRGVAQKYDLNYDSLFRKFRDEKIPHPDNSYLTRKEHGENVESQVKPLSGDPDKRIKLLTNRVVAPSEFALEDRTKQLQDLSSPNCLSFLTVADKDTACREISTITAEKDAPELPAVAGYVQLNRRRFSDEGARRAVPVLGALISALTRLGGRTRSLSEQGYYLTYRDTTLQFQMKERTTQYKRTLKELDQNPGIPRFEQRFNGTLELSIQGEIFKDEQDYTLEYQLGRILQRAIELSEEIHTKTNLAVHSAQNNEEAFQQINRLYRDADSHYRAKQIRQYVSDILLAHYDDPDVREWAEWALGQADQLDPPPQNFD